MKFIFSVMLITTSITTIGKAQNWQNLISVNSRFGYSSNTYLNPFISDWNTASESPYNLTSAILQSSWYQNGNTLSFTGSLFYEPLFSEDTRWKGGLGLINYNHRFTNNISIGLDVGGSYTSNSYSRTLFWAQPKVTAFLSPFTMVRFKAGTNFRNYQNYLNVGKESNRFDLYALEFETWPDYRWQIKTGVYGSLDTLPAIQNGFNASANIGYFFRNGASISLNGNLEQYKTRQYQQVGGTPPMGSPPNRNQQTTITVNTDRIVRFSLDGTYPINERFSVFSSAGVLHFNSESSGITENDYEVSGGIQFSFEPRFNKNRGVITPEWEKHKGQQRINIKYSGKGRLYLVGDFNNWNRTGIPLRKQSDDRYVARLNLSPGAYEYKVLRIQGDTEEWLTFSDDTYTVSDGFGSQNAMLLVE